jgi:hypothetical protein
VIAARAFVGCVGARLAAQHWHEMSSRITSRLVHHQASASAPLVASLQVAQSLQIGDNIVRTC